MLSYTIVFIFIHIDDIHYLSPTGTYYQNISGSRPSCVACIPGTYSSVLGAIGNATCLGCPGGSFSSVVGSASLDQCELCSAGK